MHPVLVLSLGRPVSQAAFLSSPPGVKAALGAWALLVAGSAWGPVLETLGRNLLPHAL